MTEPQKPDSRGTVAMIERIRNRRAALGLNGTELARRAGISPSYVSLIERGHKVPNEEAAARLARALEDDEELYRAWARAERYGLDRLDEVQRLDALTSDAGTTRMLASGRDLPRAATPPAATRASPGWLEMLRPRMARSPEPPGVSPPAAPAPAQGDEQRTFEPGGEPFLAEHAEIGDADMAVYDAMSEGVAEPERDAVVEVPVLPAGADPRRMLDATSLPPLHLDARLVGGGRSGGLFAYELDRVSAARLGEIASEGDYAVLSRRFRSLSPERVHAVRGEDDRIRLGRVLFKGNSLLLLPPAGGTDIEVVPLREDESWRDRVVGAVVLTLKRWR